MEVVFSFLSLVLALWVHVPATSSYECHGDQVTDFTWPLELGDMSIQLIPAKAVTTLAISTNASMFAGGTGVDDYFEGIELERFIKV